VGAKVEVCSDCAWRIQEPVGAQVCVDGHYQCLLCQAGATECSPSGERVACAGCAWTPAPCRPDQSCAGGSCVDRCSGSQRWCARRGTCVPRCNACEALDPNSLTCRSYCGAGKECRGDACCYPCPPGSLVCPQPQCEGAPLIQDPC
jgi:hypothetical protein